VRKRIYNKITLKSNIPKVILNHNFKSNDFKSFPALHCICKLAKSIVPDLVWVCYVHSVILRETLVLAIYFVLCLSLLLSNFCYACSVHSNNQTTIPQNIQNILWLNSWARFVDRTCMSITVYTHAVPQTCRMRVHTVMQIQTDYQSYPTQPYRSS